MVPNIDLTSWHGFWVTFKLPIAMSLIGAVIGHYRKNGVIQMPIFSIKYKRGPHFKNMPNWLIPIRWMYYLVDLVTYVIGLRWDSERPREAIWIDLGFLGDMLVGVGTGILAKTALAITNNTNPYLVISTSLLAGFAGLSYILSRQSSDMAKGTQARQQQIDWLMQNEDNMSRKNENDGKREINEGQLSAAASEANIP